MRHPCLPALLAILVTAVTGPVAHGAAAAASQPSWDRYRIVVDRNVFSRTRGRPGPARAVVARPVFQPKSPVVLRGIARRGDEHVAFIEDTGTKKTWKVKAGDALAGGRVQRITLDRVEVDRAGRTVAIQVGSSLDGTPVLAPASMPTVTSSGTATSAQPSETKAVNPKLQSILERMRQRRQKELGKK